MNNRYDLEDDIDLVEYLGNEIIDIRNIKLQKKGTNYFREYFEQYFIILKNGVRIDLVLNKISDYSFKTQFNFMNSGLSISMFCSVSKLHEDLKDSLIKVIKMYKTIL